MIKYEYMIPVYALLVRSGRWAINEAAKKDTQKYIVPQIYQEDVAEYCANLQETQASQT